MISTYWLMPSPSPTPSTPTRSRFPASYRFLHVGIWTLAIGVAFATVATTVWRVLINEQIWLFIVANAYVPYLPIIAIIATLGAVLDRNRRAAALSVATLIVLSVILVPRVLANEQPAAQGTPITIMTMNLLYNGQTEIQEITTLVKTHDVDILVVQELTNTTIAKLEKEGLGERFRYELLTPDDYSAAGAGIYSKYPIIDTFDYGGRFYMPHATIDVPRSEPIDVTSVHITAPHAPEHTSAWHDDFLRLPLPSPANTRILAGDFNSSLDHPMFRHVLSFGYRDAADEAGKALIPTWRPFAWGPATTLDHVLVADGIAVNGLSVHDVTGSDHRAVITDLTLP